MEKLDVLGTKRIGVALISCIKKKLKLVVMVKTLA